MTMTKDEMERGLASGRRLIQEEWADRDEISAVDELVAEGKATATAWQYRDGFQCEMRSVVARAALEAKTIMTENAVPPEDK